MTIVFHLPPSLFGFLHNYSVSFIYLQNIIPTDYIPTILLHEDLVTKVSFTKFTENAEN